MNYLPGAAPIQEAELQPTMPEELGWQTRLRTALFLGAISIGYVIDQYTVRVLPVQPHELVDHIKHLGPGYIGGVAGSEIARSRDRSRVVGAVVGATVANFSAEFSQTAANGILPGQHKDDFLSLRESAVVETILDYATALLGVGLLGLQTAYARRREQLRRPFRRNRQSQPVATAAVENETF